MLPTLVCSFSHTHTPRTHLCAFSPPSWLLHDDRDVRVSNDGHVIDGVWQKRLTDLMNQAKAVALMMAGWKGSLGDLISGLWTLSIQFSARSYDKDLYRIVLISCHYLCSRALWLGFFQDPRVAWTPCSVSRYQKISILAGGNPV